MTTYTTKNRNSTSYQFTVRMVEGKPIAEDQAAVDGLRTVVKLNNTAFPDDKQRYVKLQGRGPRGHNGRMYNQGLPLPYATHADVYVYERNRYNNVWDR